MLNVVVIDNAGFHHAKGLEVHRSIVFLFSWTSDTILWARAGSPGRRKKLLSVRWNSDVCKDQEIPAE